MSIHRRAARRDSNEAAIVDALRQCGYVVDRVSGTGLPDLLVRWPGDALATGVEVKTARGRLTKHQEGNGWLVWRSVDDALFWLQVQRAKRIAAQRGWVENL